MPVDDNLLLGANEFAFHFETSLGIDAQKLGAFLQRAGKVARDNGAEMRIIAIQDGSLDVVARIARSTKARIAGEFGANPVKTSAAATALTIAVIGGITRVMSPAESGATPLAKAAAQIVEQEHVENITIVSQGGDVLVMDPFIAGQVRRAEKRRQAVTPDFREAQRQIADGGELSGYVSEMDGDLYFKPDGHRYAVPIDAIDDAASYPFDPGAHYRVRGDLVIRRNRPFALVVTHAVPG